MARLLEREEELTALAQLSDRLAAGVGTAVVVEGPAGIGKTALLGALGERAEHAGVRVLRARGGELERDDQYGVVRQLFGPPLPAHDLGELPEAAEAVLGRGDAASAPPGEDAGHAAHHALFGACLHLAAERPLLVYVDDAHWADDRSLRWLLFLTRRLERGPVALALARRPAEPGAERALLDRIVEQEEVRLLRPAPLSVDATVKVVREALGSGAESEFCAACRRATDGNPFLLRELLAELRESGVAPSASSAELALSVGPESVARATLLRLARAPASSLVLARALAVLEEADLREVACLAEIDDATASDAATTLTEAGLLSPEPRLRFAHPLVRTAVYRELDHHQRSRWHAAAARVLADAGAAPERIATHLLLAERAGDTRAVEWLRAAARRAYSSGAPDAAAAYLRRALEEPAPAPSRGEVLFELGRAEVRASEADAVAHLEQAVDAVAVGAPRARVLRELARAHMRAGRMPEATVMFETAASAAGADRELQLSLEGELAATLANVTGADEAAARLKRFSELPGETPAERSVLAVLAFASVQRNEPAGIASELMERALHDGAFVREQTAATVVFADGILALLLAGCERRVLECMQPALADVRRLGWTIGLSSAPFFVAWAHLRLGELDAARAHAKASLAVSEERGWQPFTAMAGAVLCETELEAGDVPAAEAALSLAGLPEDVPDSALFQLALYARGRLRIARGESSAALADLLLCGEREVALGGVTPAAMAWRSHAALLCARLGEHERARALAEEELALARVLGTPRALAVALQAVGALERGAAGLPAIEEAVAVTRGDDVRLEHTRALVALGAALRRANRRVESREPLRRALSLANEMGVQPLAERAHAELLAAGGRPRRPALRGVDALTPSELRAAQLAAAGLSNRQIAAELVVTVRTVEFHLSRAYGKLGIESRGQLAGALAQAGEAPAPPQAAAASTRTRPPAG